MIRSFQSVFKIPELKKRIIFTLLVLVVYRIGGHVPIPGVNPDALLSYFNQVGGGGLFGLYDMFAGGAFSRATVFALGIMPYISASIIIQLLGAVMPFFQKLQKEGEEGRKKITQYTRYGTVLISALQAYGVSVFLASIPPTSEGIPVVISSGIGFTLTSILVLTSGTILIMWLGEQITERGIGNGVSLIIFIGIIARFPNALISEYQQFASGNRELLSEVILLAIMVVIIASVVAMGRSSAARRADSTAPVPCWSRSASSRDRGVTRRSRASNTSSTRSRTSRAASSAIGIGGSAPSDPGHRIGGDP